MCTEDQQKKGYLAGPMRGLPKFNFPAFNIAAKKLRSEGYFIFNPAEHDKEKYGVDISKYNRTGDETKAIEKHGFNLRESLQADLTFICLYAEVIFMLPGWENSKGANAELATAKAIGIEVIYLDESYVN